MHMCRCVCILSRFRWGFFSFLGVFVNNMEIAFLCTLFQSNYRQLSDFHIKRNNRDRCVYTEATLVAGGLIFSPIFFHAFILCLFRTVFVALSLHFIQALQFCSVKYLLNEWFYANTNTLNRLWSDVRFGIDQAQVLCFTHLFPFLLHHLITWMRFSVFVRIAFFYNISVYLCAFSIPFLLIVTDSFSTLLQLLYLHSIWIHSMLLMVVLLLLCKCHL